MFVLAQLPGFVKLNSPTYVDGYIYCSVQHPLVFNNTVSFDLNKPHYLLMATGSTGKGAYAPNKLFVSRKLFVEFSEI